MPVPQDNRKPKSQDIAARQIKTGGDPDSLEKETIAWHFHRFDREHEDWGWEKLRAPQWREVMAHLVAFEGLTWAKLKEQSGGRKRGTNHHSLLQTEFSKAARVRLKELHLDQFDTFFSLRISNTLRLYGVRDGRVLQFFWHDPYHGSVRGCYPTKK